MRKILVAASLLALGSWASGCHHSRYDYYGYHEAKAEYHHEKAESDLERGHPVGALKNKIKEGRDESKTY